MNIRNTINISYSQMKNIMMLALPLIFAQFAHMGMQIVDTLMLGQLGAQVLAAGALGVAGVGYATQGHTIDV